MKNRLGDFLRFAQLCFNLCLIVNHVLVWFMKMLLMDSASGLFWLRCFFFLFELHLRKIVGIKSMNQELCRYCKICRRNLKLGKMIQLMEVSPTRSIILFPFPFVF